MRVRSGLLLASPLILFMVFAGYARPNQVIELDGIAPILSASDLASAASTVAIVSSTGERSDRWNSSDGKHWERQPANAVQPMIYSDVELNVVQVLQGDPVSTITVRKPGGTADGYHMVFRGLDDMVPGVTYLVFLERVETPTEDGFESAVSFVALGQGVFRLSGEAWANSAGLEISLDELARLTR